MCNLIRSGFFRYLHSRVFKVCLALTFVVALLFSYRIYHAAELSDPYFVAASVLVAVLISLMIGNETSKRIRNKLSVGYTKTQIYFSEMILANIFAIMFFGMFLAVAVVMNITLLPHTPVKAALQAILGFLCMTLLFANIFASISCMLSSRTVSVIVCLVLIIATYITSTLVAGMLSEKEFHSSVQINENGETVYLNKKNPKYIDEPLRGVLTFYHNVNPYGQRIEYEKILLPYLYEDEYWEKAMEATANTIGNDFLKREISDDEQDYLDRTPMKIIVPIPVFIIVGYLVFRKKSFV